MPIAIVCPFYSWEDKLRLHCECAKIEFPSVEARREYIDKFCANTPGWKTCGIAEGLQNEYERRDGNAEEN